MRTASGKARPCQALPSIKYSSVDKVSACKVRPCRRGKVQSFVRGVYPEVPKWARATLFSDALGLNLAAGKFVFRNNLRPDTI